MTANRWWHLNIWAVSSTPVAKEKNVTFVLCSITFHSNPSSEPPPPPSASPPLEIREIGSWKSVSKSSSVSRHLWSGSRSCSKLMPLQEATNVGKEFWVDTTCSSRAQQPESSGKSFQRRKIFNFRFEAISTTTPATTMRMAIIQRHLILLLLLLLLQHLLPGKFFGKKWKQFFRTSLLK